MLSNCSITTGTVCTNCTECKPGFLSGKQCTTFANQECTPCPQGYFCPNKYVLAPCTLGSYCPPQSTSNQNCTPGYFCPNTTTRLPCPIGYSCPIGSSSPSLCPAGKFSNSTQMSSCLTCPASTYSPNLGMTSCISCSAAPLGMYRTGCVGEDSGNLQRCTNTP